ncbi:hypothetical protein QYE76_024317 [Lolium multiflorum]|uniref:RNase H type-1 domain-containing protein n=1 Tax=Lolium multiflorum TaxID=4521 RepID=A0AAD8VVL4_LOLMU|nr:hypothetical protein QYE76_024317 [Lolium multiflorum]
MKLAGWNGRGFGNGPAIRGLLDFQKTEDPDVLFLSETKMEKGRLDWLRWKMGMPHLLEKPCVGKSGGLAIFWKRGIDVKLTGFMSKYHIDTEITEEDGFVWRFTGTRGEELMGHIDPRVTQPMNELLCKEFTAKEVVEALDSIGDLKAPGPDGQWDEALVRNNFWEIDAKTILAMPICEDFEDFLALQYDSKGVFTVKSAYKLYTEIRDGPHATSSNASQELGLQEIHERMCQNQSAKTMVEDLLGLGEEQKILVACTLWCCWTRRNKINAKEKEMALKELLSQINYWTSESKQYFLTDKLPEGPRAELRWSAPAEDWIKFNTDGAFCQADNHGGWGFIARDNQSTVRGAGTGHLKAVVSAAQAEAVACMEALHAASDWGIQNVIVETDSSILVQSIETSDYDRAPEGVIYRDIRAFIRLNFNLVKVEFRPRGCNKVAHVLAAMGANQADSRQGSLFSSRSDNTSSPRPPRWSGRGRNFAQATAATPGCRLAPAAAASATLPRPPKSPQLLPPPSLPAIPATEGRGPQLRPADLAAAATPDCRSFSGHSSSPSTVPSTCLYCASSSFVITGSASLLWSMDALIFDGDNVIL